MRVESCWQRGYFTTPCSNVEDYWRQKRSWGKCVKSYQMWMDLQSLNTSQMRSWFLSLPGELISSCFTSFCGTFVGLILFLLFCVPFLCYFLHICEVGFGSWIFASYFAGFFTVNYKFYTCWSAGEKIRIAKHAHPKNLWQSWKVVGLRKYQLKTPIKISTRISSGQSFAA